MRRIPRAAALTLAAVGLWTVAPAAQSSTWRVTEGDVRVTCPLTVGGSFEARTTAFTGTLSTGDAQSRSLVGELTVDLKTLDTGIDLRNAHLRERYLEIDKGEGFERAVLSDVTFADGNARSFEGQTQFTGTLLLHGTRRAVVGQARIRRRASGVTVDASFPVALTDYGIPAPRYLGVGVRNEVHVRVAFTATSVTRSSAVTR